MIEPSCRTVRNQYKSSPCELTPRPWISVFRR